MVQATIPKDLDIYADENDPEEPGDIKLVMNPPLVIQRCEAINDGVAEWSVHTGTGVSISVNQSNPAEGTGCIRANIPSNFTGPIIVKATKLSGSWDFRPYKYLKVWLRSYLTPTNFVLYFGETNYNEQSKNVTVGTGWKQLIWDISDISSASKDAVTIFAVAVSIIRPRQGMYFDIDYTYCVASGSEVKAFDGDRVIRLYPKVYVGNYTGNGTTQTIDIPRKGTPSAVYTQRFAGTTSNGGILKTKNMSGAQSQQVEGGAILTTAITSFFDCGFTVGSHIRANNSGDPYVFIAFFED